ncbi:hypothetical protein PAPYR_11544 [Paratrimastix pyriformis]|uniref:Uncharacterized protein n=1 Tax=Paratrimastix pyriformis TaxID=342808 RepID=A0ABQ8U927_9EUKA|nr:hypothetical protein PAPYR_11544 [Paratrimastix pyriformis]
MACEITAVNDDLDDETSAFIEKHASILDEDDPFLCFIDVLDDHRAIFRSMDQLSRLSFTSTMILFPPASAYVCVVLEQKVGGSIPASDGLKKPEGFPGTYGRPPRRKVRSPGF